MFDEFAAIYEACAHYSLGPRAVDELELWEVAAVIGANHPAEPTATPAPAANGNGRTFMSLGQFNATAADLGARTDG